LKEKILIMSRNDEMEASLKKSSHKTDASNMQDIILYSDFANRLLNQTSDKEFNKRYQAYRKKMHPHKMMDFYERMENDTKRRKNK
jgi:hypothetical protein